MTNLNGLKAVSKMLLRIPIEGCEFSPAVVIHPYTNSGFFFLDDFIDLTTDEGFDKYCDKMESVIDSAQTPIELMTLLQTQYAMTWLKYSKEFLSLDDFSELLGIAWVGCENANMDVNVPISESVQWFREANKRKLMDEDEYKVYESIPEEITLYRGVARGRVEKGMSWTASKGKAEWFMHRFGGEGYLLEMKAKKEDVLAYFSRRDEDEYLVYPKNYKRR